MNLLKYDFFTCFVYCLATTPAVNVIFQPEAIENNSTIRMDTSVLRTVLQSEVFKTLFTFST